jgi:hypothetical protein
MELRDISSNTENASLEPKQKKSWVKPQVQDFDPNVLTQKHLATKQATDNILYS